MIAEIKTEFPNVKVFEATGKISRDNYRQVLEPAIEELKSHNQEMNLVYILNTDISNYSLGAMWEDGLVGISNLRKFHRIAVVSEKKWINESIEFFGKLIRGECKGFHLGERQAAIDWAAGKS